MTLPTAFRSSEAEDLYRESLADFGAPSDPLSEPLVDLIYYNAALEDEGSKASIGQTPSLTIEEAKKAYETLDRCFPKTCRKTDRHQ